MTRASLGTLYVADDHAAVTCIDAATGAVRWTRPVGGPATRVPSGQAGSRHNVYASSLLPVGDVGIVGTYDGAVTALDLRAGISVLGICALDSIEARGTSRWPANWIIGFPGGGGSAASTGSR